MNNKSFEKNKNQQEKLKKEYSEFLLESISGLRDILFNDFEDLEKLQQNEIQDLFNDYLLVYKKLNQQSNITKDFTKFLIKKFEIQAKNGIILDLLKDLIYSIKNYYKFLVEHSELMYIKDRVEIFLEQYKDFLKPEETAYIKKLLSKYEFNFDRKEMQEELKDFQKNLLLFIAGLRVRFKQQKEEIDNFIKSFQNLSKLRTFNNSKEFLRLYDFLKKCKRYDEFIGLKDAFLNNFIKFLKESISIYENRLNNLTNFLDFNDVGVFNEIKNSFSFFNFINFQKFKFEHPEGIINLIISTLVEIDKLLSYLENKYSVDKKREVTTKLPFKESDTSLPKYEGVGVLETDSYEQAGISEVGQIDDEDEASLEPLGVEDIVGDEGEEEEDNFEDEELIPLTEEDLIREGSEISIKQDFSSEQGGVQGFSESGEEHFSPAEVIYEKESKHPKTGSYPSLEGFKSIEDLAQLGKTQETPRQEEFETQKDIPGFLKVEEETEGGVPTLENYNFSLEGQSFDSGKSGVHISFSPSQVTQEPKVAKPARRDTNPEIPALPVQDFSSLIEEEGEKTESVKHRRVFDDLKNTLLNLNFEGSINFDSISQIFLLINNSFEQLNKFSFDELTPEELWDSNNEGVLNVLQEEFQNALDFIDKVQKFICNQENLIRLIQDKNIDKKELDKNIKLVLKLKLVLLKLQNEFSIYRQVFMSRNEFILNSEDFIAKLESLGRYNIEDSIFKEIKNLKTIWKYIIRRKNKIPNFEKLLQNINNIYLFELDRYFNIILDEFEKYKKSANQYLPHIFRNKLFYYQKFLQLKEVAVWFNQQFRDEKFKLVVEDDKIGFVKK